MNEVKYCYDQALARQPKLDGRLVTQFTISGTGQVLASVVQSSTLRSPAVEMCVSNAIKRWQFPAPEKGGLVIVSYPFQFSPAAANCSAVVNLRQLGGGEDRGEAVRAW